MQELKELQKERIHKKKNKLKGAYKMANKKKKKNNYEERPISFKEMVECRKQEMAMRILPGFYSVVRDPYTGREEKVCSPSIKDRATFTIGDFGED